MFHEVKIVLILLSKFLRLEKFVLAHRKTIFLVRKKFFSN